MPLTTPFRTVNIDDSTAAIVAGLLEIGNVLRYLQAQQAREHHLSVLQMEVLLWLHCRTGGQPTVTALANTLRLTKATLSVAVKALVQKQLVNRRTQQEDGRSVFLSLTERGEQIAHIAGFYPEPVRRIVASLGVEQKTAFLENLQGILRRLQQG